MFDSEIRIRSKAEALTGEELVARVLQGAADQASHMAGWLALVAELDRREVWGVEGAQSCAQFLAWKCGLVPRTAREQVRVARQLDSLPAIQGAFGEGRLSYSRVRALCRVATPANEAFLLGLALALSARDLEASLAAYAAAHREPLSLDDDTARRARCGVTRWIEPDGVVRYEVLAPPEEAMVIDKAIEFGRDQVHKKNKAAAVAKGSTERVRRVSGPLGKLEGLAWAIENGPANIARGVEIDDPYLIVIPVQEGAAFVGDDGRVDLGNGLTLHPRTLQRLCCSSMIQVMLSGDDGERPLDLGRTARLPNRKQRRALRAMYATCRFPGGCDVASERCRPHHVAWWGRDQGPTDLDNLVPLCDWHHRQVHEGGWGLVFGLDGLLVAISPTGKRHETAPALALPPSDPAALARSLRLQGVAPDGSALMGEWGGERMTWWARGVVMDAIFRELDGPEQHLLN
ncbi:MAG TPA: DUF222 domain-containing protein [Acidimicrobiales bacterium]|nr:DUF222 domain-containing protein [Acidimicrobiales bacterium]